MDIFLVIGIVVGVLSVVVGMIVKGANVAVLINPAAAIIVLVGTVAAVMNSYPKNEFLNAARITKKLFKGDSDQDSIAIIEEIVEVAKMTRKDGLLSIEDRIEAMDNKFMKLGLELVVDGADPEYVRDILTTEIDSTEERHRGCSMIFSTAGSSAPTLGVLGAVIGLIGALGNLDDTEMLAHMISAAFVATLYGIFFGYVICHPFANRLKRKSNDEINNMYLILEGVLAVQEGMNPNLIQKKLLSMIKPSDKLKFLESRQGEK
jgi:chemotaxis protein MotA